MSAITPNNVDEFVEVAFKDMFGISLDEVAGSVLTITLPAGASSMYKTLGLRTGESKPVLVFDVVDYSLDGDIHLVYGTLYFTLSTDIVNLELYEDNDKISDEVSIWFFIDFDGISGEIILEPQVIFRVSADVTSKKYQELLPAVELPFPAEISFTKKA
jgi:hypothetical protein